MVHDRVSVLLSMMLVPDLGHVVSRNIILLWLNYLFLIFDIHSRVHIKPDEQFLKTGQYPVLTVMSAGHALHVFINGQLSGKCRVAFHGNQEDLLLNKLCLVLIIRLQTNSSVLWQELCLGDYQIPN